MSKSRRETKISFYIPYCFHFFSLAKNVKANSAPKDRIDPGRKKFRNFIHPAFKKRSIDEKLTPLEKFDLNLHRQSRHALYRQLETFLQT